MGRESVQGRYYFNKETLVVRLETTSKAFLKWTQKKTLTTSAKLAESMWLRTRYFERFSMGKSSLVYFFAVSYERKNTAAGHWSMK